MHRGLYGLGGKHRRQAVGDVDHRVAELAKLVVGGDLDLFARDELRNPFLALDLGRDAPGSARLPPALSCPATAKDLVFLLRLAAPVQGGAWGVTRPLRVGNLGIDLAVGQRVDAATPDGLLDRTRRDSAMAGVRPLAHDWHAFIPEKSPCLPVPPE
jgi:hypothetical protein